MSWKSLLAGILLLPVQTTPTHSTSATEASRVIVELGDFPVKGLWFQDGDFHAHDDGVKLQSTYRPDGAIEVTIGRAGYSGTDLTFLFSHDAAGETRALATALFRADVSTKEGQKTWHLSELEGRALVLSNDWGPGKRLEATFAVRGLQGRSPQLLMGSFSLVPPK